MLSPVIKRMLEERIGYEIRYPSDCERLMYEIAESTHQHIGVTTLKRLFGFIGGTSTPRQSTLDILGNFLGYRSYNDLIRSLDPDNEAEHVPILQLDAQDIPAGVRVRVFFNGGYLCVEHEKDTTFRVLKSTDTTLLTGDRVRICSFRVGYPVYIRQRSRNGLPQDPCALAKVSGIERIETESDENP